MSLMKLSQYNSQKDPAMCFVGVTTSKSFVNRVFSSWVEIIGVNANLIGLDLALDSSVDIYRSVVNSIKSNDMILGSLVTSHKTNIYQYCNGLFDIITPGSEYLKEIGVIYKDGKQLACDATDPDAQMQVLKRLIPYGHWGKSKAQALILGAGGAGLALAYSLLNSKEQPTKIIITEINSDRIYQTKQVLKRYIDDGLVEVVNVKEISADTLLSRLPRGSLVANATGMGKDLPGSPISEKAEFPQDAIVWEFNYRGDLEFLKIAEVQKGRRNLFLEDGWDYFICGWTYVMSKVFHFKPTEELLAQFSSVAESFRE